MDAVYDRETDREPDGSIYREKNRDRNWSKEIRKFQCMQNRGEVLVSWTGKQRGLGPSITRVDTGTDILAQHPLGWPSKMPKCPGSSASSRRNQPEPLLVFSSTKQLSLSC